MKKMLQKYLMSEGIMGTCTWEDQCGCQELRTGDTGLWIQLAHPFAVLVETSLHCALQSAIVQISVCFLSHGCHQEMFYREPGIWPESEGTEFNRGIFTFELNVPTPLTFLFWFDANWYTWVNIAKRPSRKVTTCHFAITWLLWDWIIFHFHFVTLAA